VSELVPRAVHRTISSASQTMLSPNGSGPERLLTVKDAAGRLACSEAAIRKWIAQGRLRAVRVGRLVRVRPADLERMVVGG
jgi:excisionase family DNA binding protein